MAASKNRKKKRISKHVLKAKDGSTTTAQTIDAAAAAALPPPASAKPKKSRRRHHVKDPIEAASYLSSWKHRDAGGSWKFNKNTQSWLLRHMYDSDKVQKTSFELLLEYMNGGEGAKSRVIQDAERRALRYKEHEKAAGSDAKNKGEVAEASATSNVAAKPTDVDEDGEDDETRWKRLKDHDKRKEYKRARKVLEAFREDLTSK